MKKVYLNPTTNICVVIEGLNFIMSPTLMYNPKDDLVPARLRKFVH